MVGSSAIRDTAVSTASRRIIISIWNSRIGDVLGRLDGLRWADRTAAQEI
jgi:hypothetical protein